MSATLAITIMKCSFATFVISVWLTSGAKVSIEYLPKTGFADSVEEMIRVSIGLGEGRDRSKLNRIDKWKNFKAVV